MRKRGLGLQVVEKVLRVLSATLVSVSRTPLQIPDFHRKFWVMGSVIGHVLGFAMELLVHLWLEHSGGRPREVGGDPRLPSEC